MSLNFNRERGSRRTSALSIWEAMMEGWGGGFDGPEPEDELPREVSRGTITLFGVQIDVIQLDNGQRILDAEGFERLMRVMANDGLDLKDITPADFGDGS
jgi:hypothetical protein